MTSDPCPVEITLQSFVVGSFLAQVRGQSLEAFVAETLKKEIRASRKELDTFALQEMTSEELGRLVERFRKEDCGGA